MLTLPDSATCLQGYAPDTSEYNCTQHFQKALLEEAGVRGRAPVTALTCRRPGSGGLPAYAEKTITVQLLFLQAPPLSARLKNAGRM